MELMVSNGRGYVLASKNKSEDTPLGMIAIDSLFSPVKKVSFKIDSTRAGAALDYDKLIMMLHLIVFVLQNDYLNIKPLKQNHHPF